MSKPPSKIQDVFIRHRGSLTDRRGSKSKIKIENSKNVPGFDHLRNEL